MAALTTTSTLQFFFLLMIQAATFISCYQYKVGDLHAWNKPTSANPDIYAKWSENHKFQLGDSLFFLYPPSQDSVLQVTPQHFKSCNRKNPILTMNDGNSVYNITIGGEFYFISGVEGHCEKAQKIQISVPAENGSVYVYPPAEAPSAADAESPSGGAIPDKASSSSSSQFSKMISPIFLSAILVLVISFVGSGSS
ncbi:OLC1v1028891C1 [Oldenlandia corymbosa var. corymbosa]|uniref:OLC1v1028891C1 n=1 Tax=Oldenlandia corymbosa var. corymbosa TaxID=529605 RepID=A0AAV1CE22_OLDCO|nr:OLC1v1028891C1 [Oldenlandia corymbosa var. corymbosa]